jgi:hypothetical protein
MQRMIRQAISVTLAIFVSGETGPLRAEPALPRPSSSDLRAVEAQIHLPVGAHHLRTYVRYYAVTQIRTVDDLPFTTICGCVAVKPNTRVFVGVLVLPPTATATELVVRGPPRVVVSALGDLPNLVHGGCEVVNVVVDATSRKTLGSWCNYDDRPKRNRRGPSHVWTPSS